MHQLMLLEDSDFVLTRISDTISTDDIPVKSEQKTVNIKTNNQNRNTQRIVYVEEQPAQDVKVVKREVKLQEEPIQNKTSQMELLQRVLKNTENSQVVKQPSETKKVIEQKPVIVQKPEPKPEPQKIVQQKPVQNQNSNPYMTAEEEIIAWNLWRSNIQNQIMRDSDIEIAPLGTVFTFTFIVDKFGNVSNIKVDCSNPAFMDVARNNVKPAIVNLQKKPILNFPKGTKRTSTVFTGMFLIGTQTRYSTPENYSDYERVIR